MTTVVHLDTELREKTGKGDSHALRRAGRVPAVVYGGTDSPIHFSLSLFQLHKILHKEGFSSTVFEATFSKKKETMLAREVNFHPVTDLPLHVDFIRVSKDRKLTLSVPLRFLNEDKSPGIKRGGVLNILIHKLDIISDIDHIPSHIDIDLTGVDIHHTIHLKDLSLPEKVVPAHPERDDSIANVVAPTVMKKAGGEGETPDGKSSTSGAPAGK